MENTSVNFKNDLKEPKEPKKLKKPIFITPQQKYASNVKAITNFLRQLKEADNILYIGYYFKTPEPDQLYSVLLRGGDPVIILRMERAYIVQPADKLVRFMFDKKIKLYK